MPKRSLLFCVLMLCSGLPSARAQSSVSIDYDVGPLMFVSQQPNVVNRFNATGTGSGTEHVMGISYHHPIVSTGSLQLLIDGGISAGFGSYRSDAFGIQARTFSLTSQSVAATLGADIALPLVSRTHLAVGPWLTVPISRTIEERISGSAGDSLLASGAALARSSLPFGVRAEIGYTISRRLSTSVTMSTDLGRIRETGQPEYSGGISISWLLRATDSVTPPIAKDTKPRVPAPIIRYAAPSERAPLTATVSILQDGRETESRVAVSLTPIDTLFREYVMLPTRIISVSALPARRELTNDSTVRMSPADIASNALNVIATRLTAEPKGKLTLRVGPRLIDRDIADAIQRYLGEALQHKVHRVTSLDTGVALEAKPASLLDPVATQWIERTYDISTLQIVPHVFRGSAPAANAVTRVLAIVDGRQMDLTPADDSSFAFPRLVPTTASRSVVLRVESQDSGDRVVASDTLSIAYLAPLPAREAHLVTRFLFFAEHSGDRGTRSLLARLSETRDMKLIEADASCDGDAYCDSLEKEIARTANISPDAIRRHEHRGDPSIELTFER